MTVVVVESSIVKVAVVEAATVVTAPVSVTVVVPERGPGRGLERCC